MAGLRRARLEGDAVAQALEALDQAPLDGLAGALVEEVLAEVLVGRGRAPEEGVGDGEEGVPQRERRPLLAPARGQAAGPRAEVGVLGAPGRLAGLDQSGA